MGRTDRDPRSTSTPFAERLCVRSYRFNEEVKHIKVVEKDNWIHITEAKKFESLLVCP